MPESLIQAFFSVLFPLHVHELDYSTFRAEPNGNTSPRYPGPIHDMHG